VALDEFFPAELDRRPSCQLTRQWDKKDPDGTKIVRYAGADGYLYESVEAQDGRLRWKRVARNR